MILQVFLTTPQRFLPLSPDICREFGHGDDANAWRKSTKEADKDKDFLLQLTK